MMLRMAVERAFTIAGEALSQLRKSDPETAAAVPDVARIVGFRNVLIHSYLDVKDRVVWDAAVDRVPELVAAITELLGAEPSVE